jgi:uncharacterized protein YhhL (DUF1145 family)
MSFKKYLVGLDWFIILIELLFMFLNKEIDVVNVMIIVVAFMHFYATVKGDIKINITKEER